MITVYSFFKIMWANVARPRRDIEFDIDYNDIEECVDKARIADTRVRMRIDDEDLDAEAPYVKFRIRPYRLD